MKFFSTRGMDQVDNASLAIVKGLADDGGLFVPESFPNFSDKIEDLVEKSYAERATEVIGSFLNEYDKKDLLVACENAYSRFDDEDAAPVIKLDENFYIMELFHGPTLAFKDVALTLLPYLLRTGADNAGVKEKILILVATSGDTGKAALEGFKDANGIDISVFYPTGGVSDMQKLQMSTSDGQNVNVCAINGNFDDCQNAVKKIFSDKNFSNILKEKGIVLSSANSINFGRLVPQITYYFSAYCDMLACDEIKLGDKVNFCVPTGNFGNILAGYYAKKMGLPINKLICASNQNNVLTEFFVDGSYDANREFFKTISPSMDILVSSNLERLIFEMSGRNYELTKNRMQDLKVSLKYEITKSELKDINNEFFADFCDEEECQQTIFDIFEEYGYVLDPHTSVAVDVYNKYSDKYFDAVPTVILSTASPYKFAPSVLKALTGKTVKDAFKATEMLYELTAEEIPQAIKDLRNKNVRFSEVVDKKDIFEYVKKLINK